MTYKLKDCKIDLKFSDVFTGINTSQTNQERTRRSESKRRNVK